jgi:hypothetical protein
MCLFLLRSIQKRGYARVHSARTTPDQLVVNTIDKIRIVFLTQKV